MTTITERLAQLRKLANAATEGPWEQAPEVDGVHAVAERQTVVRRAGGKRIVEVGQIRPHEREYEANVAFIAASREAVPALLSAVEKVLAITNTFPPDDHRYAPGYPIADIRAAIAEALGCSDA